MESISFSMKNYILTYNLKMEKRFQFIVLMLSSIAILFSCERKNQDLEDALIFAGENRAELEAVLSHYSLNPEDSLKYRAACFLIENMPGHYSYKDTAYINKYYDELDSLAVAFKNMEDNVKDSLYKYVADKYKDKLDFVSDSHVMTADYLISNIEEAFDVWQNGEWSRHVNFDDFCEYILPYKVTETQSFDNWREYFRDYYNGSSKKYHNNQLLKNAAYNACETVNNALRDSVNPRLTNENILPVRRMSTLTKVPTGLCEDYNILGLAVMRAKGIPTIMDHTPQWAFRSLGHSWNVLIQTSGKMDVYEGAGANPSTPHKEEHPMAKVFRKTYAINKDLVKLHSFQKYIPTAFGTYCMKDVSEEYLDTRDITVAVEASYEHKYAYLAVFDDANWVPIHFGEVLKNKVTFDKMGKRIAYLPVFYESNGIKSFSDPILLTVAGQQIQLTPDTINKQTLTLKRKFPPFDGLYEVSERVVGGRFQTATSPLFRDSVTHHMIEEFGIYAREVDLSQVEDSARYWRYYPPDRCFGNIAELYFYEKDSINPTMGKIIGTKGSYREGTKYAKEAAFDGDALTFFDAPRGDGCWVGMDFGKPVKIDRIVYLPRNDGNCVEIGDEYELLYWGNNKWQSMGRKIADYIALTYEDCPTNALFLLRNHTKGKEERIFTYENNEQVWW